MTHSQANNSSIIHIPATEFPTAHTPPPTHLRPKLSSPDRARRRLDAEHHRAAALRSMAHRCRAHVRHATNVATTVKAKRLAEARLRHDALASTLAHAHSRRMEHLSRRALSSPQRSEQLKNRHRERSTKYQSRHIGRIKASERRSRILSERKERAARFSPSRNSYLSDSSSSLSFDVPVSRSLEFDDDSAPLEHSFLPVRTLHISHAANNASAAELIASYYLLFRGRRELTKAGVLGPQVASCDFSTLTDRLGSQGAQAAAELVLRAAGLRECARRTAAHEAAEQRILLSCLVIALHPEAVLDHRDRNHSKPESLTLCCARRMLLSLQVGTLSAVKMAWNLWKKAFVSWKKRDAETIVRTMIDDAVATESMRVAVNKGFAQSENVRELRYALGGAHSDDGVSRQEHAAWEEGIARKQQMLRDGIVKVAGKTGERRLNLALSALSDAHNERMVHEILVDLPALLDGIRKPVPIPEDTWTRLQSELLAEPPVREELASRLADISASLNTLMPGSFSLEGVSSPVELNIEFAVNVVSRATEALQKSQAEAFDDELQEWCENAVLRLRNSGTQFVEIVVDVLKELTKLIQRSHTYLLLYKIRHSAPVVQQYGAAWERAHFQGHIDSGKFLKKLPRTKLLCRQILQDSGRDEASLLSDIQEGKPAALRRMFIRAIGKLASEMDIRTAEEIPELLYLDQERIAGMQNDVQRCVLIASLDNIGRQFLHSKRLNISAEVRNDLLNVTEKERTTLQDIQDAFVEWISRVLEEDGKSLTDDDKDLLRRMVHRTAQPGDKTFNIIRKRVIEAIEEVAEQMISDKARSSASRSRDGGEYNHNKKGLEGVSNLIGEVSSRVCSVVSHLLSVHWESVQDVVRSL